MSLCDFYELRTSINKLKESGIMTEEQYNEMLGKLHEKFGIYERGKK